MRYLLAALLVLALTAPAWADNGFLSATPGARHGASERTGTSGYCYAQKFTVPGSGTITISEIGLWYSADEGETAVVTVVIYTDDAVNGCPEGIVSNSQTDLSQTDTSVSKEYHTYGTKPEVTGGADYWLGYFPTDSYGNIDYDATGGDSANDGWAGSIPSGDTWHTHTDRTYDHGIYVVYDSGETATLSGGTLSGGTLQ